MFGFPWRGKPHIRVDHPTPSAQPSPTAEVMARIDAIDWELNCIGLIPAKHRQPQEWNRMDELLDERSSLCALLPPAPVTVIPGGVS